MAAPSRAGAPPAVPPKPAVFSVPHIGVDEIHLKKLIGKGCFGKVYLGECRSIEVAVKVPNKQKLSTRVMRNFCKEVEIMSKIYHPNVCLFMGACTTPGHIRIIQEKLSGDLEARIHSDEVIPLVKRLQWCKEACQGMAWLHGCDPPVIHRDLKPANLLYDENDRVKVCDFGLSHFMEEGIHDKEPKGTPLYMAPEVMLKDEITPKVDIYSMGIIMWEMYTRQDPFSNHDDYDTFVNAVVHKGERPPIPPDCPQSLQNLMKACWATDPAKRPEFSKIVIELEKIIAEVEVLEFHQKIDAAVEDANGRKFWKSCFSKDKISWRDFARAFWTGVLPAPAPAAAAAAADPAAPAAPLSSSSSSAAAAASSSSSSLRKSASLEGWPGLGIPLPDDPTDRPLSASPTAAELARAARGQLTEYASRSAEAAEQVKEELKRRAGSDLPMGYGMNSYSYDDEDDEAGAAWQFSEDTRRLLCVKALLVTDDENESVTLEEFGALCARYGPLEIPYQPDGFLKRIIDMMSNSWFHGNLSSRQAENLLKVHRKGTFLVRFSGSQSNAFCISKVSKGSEGTPRIVKHIVVPHIQGKGFRLEGKFYPTMQQLVTDASKQLNISEPCEGSKYAWLFETYNPSSSGSGSGSVIKN